MCEYVCICMYVCVCEISSCVCGVCLAFRTLSRTHSLLGECLWSGISHSTPPPPTVGGRVAVAVAVAVIVIAVVVVVVVEINKILH